MISAVYPHKQAVLNIFISTQLFMICEWFKHLHDSENQLKKDYIRSKSWRPKWTLGWKIFNCGQALKQKLWIKLTHIVPLFLVFYIKFSILPTLGKIEFLCQFNFRTKTNPSETSSWLRERERRQAQQIDKTNWPPCVSGSEYKSCNYCLICLVFPLWYIAYSKETVHYIFKFVNFNKI